MKKIIVIVMVILAHTVTAEEEMPVDPFKLNEMPTPGLYPSIAKIELTTHQTVNDAVKQIIAGLPAEKRNIIVMDVPESELEKMPVKKDLRLHNVPINVLFKYLSECSPIGFRFSNNQWHIGKERADDEIDVKYVVTEALLDELGVVKGPGESFTTKSGGMWPPESYWFATFVPIDPETKKKPETGAPSDSKESVVLRLHAARSYQEEFNAVLLLKSRGYEKLSFDR